MKGGGGLYNVCLRKGYNRLYRTDSTFLWYLQVLELLADVRGMIPALIDLEGAGSVLQDDPSPLNVVLLQEIQRYNSLLATIKYERLFVCVLEML